ncbi:MAG: homocysteine S-methyltransferase [Ancrocorticia sp.]|uniref:homocysteine S-methyltransferase n=1 Tax=Ancrocorticia sp. TaxID=2593684 RepID=UPI003F8FF908
MTAAADTSPNASSSNASSSNASSLDALLSTDRAVMLDGGLGTHLAARGNDITGALWSATILRNNPSEVRAAHEDFFRAGADVATTCSYQVTFDGLEQAGATEAQTEELLRESVRVAREAADLTPPVGRKRLVAASIGPYGAGPGPGTEYDGQYGLTVTQLQKWHRRRIQVLAKSQPDFLLAETIPSILEVEALAKELEKIPLPAILSVTVADGQLRDGTPLAEVAQIAVNTPSIRAIGVNCCSAADALAALRALRPVTNLPFAAYPNSGEEWDHEARAWTGAAGPSSIADSVPALVNAGARLIGGCCRVSPHDIATMAKAAAQWM